MRSFVRQILELMLDSHSHKVIKIPFCAGRIVVKEVLAITIKQLHGGALFSN